MIELKHDSLVFSFPEVHEQAVMEVSFQRTLRIPDDGGLYPLPPGLGRFPMRHVDDHARKVPWSWHARGGVLLPMYQSEAMWLNFSSRCGYPFLVKVAAGKINAVTGEPWDEDVNRKSQDYLVVPRQPWLDGYCVAKGEIRQFVAMPLGKGYTAEEQITGEAEHGGLQIMVHPLKAAKWREIAESRNMRGFQDIDMMNCCLKESRSMSPDMGLAPGGRMHQEIYDDPYEARDWDREHRSRCFVHVANSLTWRAITGEAPPTMPPTAKQYSEWGLPWFDWYDDGATALEGSEKLGKLKSVVELSDEKGEAVLPENESTDPKRVVVLGKRRGDRVREGAI